MKVMTGSFFGRNLKYIYIYIDLSHDVMLHIPRFDLLLRAQIERRGPAAVFSQNKTIMLFQITRSLSVVCVDATMDTSLLLVLLFLNIEIQ